MCRVFCSDAERRVEPEVQNDTTVWATLDQSVSTLTEMVQPLPIAGNQGEDNDVTLTEPAEGESLSGLVSTNPFSAWATLDRSASTVTESPPPVPAPQAVTEHQDQEQDVTLTELGTGDTGE